jgi:hypothetical protein
LRAVDGRFTHALNWEIKGKIDEISYPADTRDQDEARAVMQGASICIPDQPADADHFVFRW